MAEGDAGTSDAGKAAGEGEAAAFGGEGLGAAEEVAEGGEGVEDVGEARVRMARHGGDAEFGAAVMEAGGGDVGLAVGSPVDFDVGGRRCSGREAEVGAEAEAPGAGMGGVETGPGADAGGGAVGANDPAGANRAGLAGECGGLVGSEDNRGVEGEADAEGGGAVAEELMEVGAAQTEAARGWGSWRRRGHWRRRRRFRRRGGLRDRERRRGRRGRGVLRA